MKEEDKKMVGPLKISVMIAALLVGAFFRTVKHATETGELDKASLAASVVSFIVGLLVVLFVVRRANKPESER